MVPTWLSSWQLSPERLASKAVMPLRGMELGLRALRCGSRVFDQSRRQLDRQVLEVAFCYRHAWFFRQFRSEVEVDFGAQQRRVGACPLVGRAAFAQGLSGEAFLAGEEAEVSRGGGGKGSRNGEEQGSAKEGSTNHFLPPWPWCFLCLRCFFFGLCFALPPTLMNFGAGLPEFATRVPGVGSSGASGSG